LDDDHHALRVAGQDAYGRLLAEEPDLPVQMNGALWWEEQGAGLRKLQTDLSQLGYPVEKLTQAKAQSREPDVKTFPKDVLAFPSEGAAESARLANALLAKAQAIGAHRLTGLTVTDVRPSSGVETDNGFIAADHVVLATGTGAPQILNNIGVKLPMLTRPGVMVVSGPVDAKINSVLVTPEGEVRQLPDGRLMSPAAANHQSDSAETVDGDLHEIGERTCARLARLIGVDHLACEEVTLAYRPVPQDERPVIGPVRDGLSVAVMHSGVTLAAITGELMTAVVTKKASNAQQAMLAPYSIDRFNAG